jgi:hypothetical protein
LEEVLGTQTPPTLKVLEFVSAKGYKLKCKYYFLIVGIVFLMFAKSNGNSRFFDFPHVLEGLAFGGLSLFG